MFCLSQNINTQWNRIIKKVQAKKTREIKKKKKKKLLLANEKSKKNPSN